MCNKLQKIGKRIHISSKHMYQYSSQILEYFVWPLLFVGSRGFLYLLVFVWVFFKSWIVWDFPSLFFFFRYLSERFIIWLMNVYSIRWHYDDKYSYFNYTYELHPVEFLVSLCNFFVFWRLRKRWTFNQKQKILFHVTI